VSVQYGSHVWSRLLIAILTSVNEGGAGGGSGQGTGLGRKPETVYAGSVDVIGLGGNAKCSQL